MQDGDYANARLEARLEALNKADLVTLAARLTIGSTTAHALVDSTLSPLVPVKAMADVLFDSNLLLHVFSHLSLPHAAAAAPLEALHDALPIRECRL